MSVTLWMKQSHMFNIKMNAIEMVFATRIRYSQDFLLAILLLLVFCLIFKEGIIQVLHWVIERLQETYFLVKYRHEIVSE